MQHLQLTSQFSTPFILFVSVLAHLYDTSYDLTSLIHPLVVGCFILVVEYHDIQKIITDLFDINQISPISGCCTKASSS